MAYHFHSLRRLTEAVLGQSCATLQPSSKRSNIPLPFPFPEAIRLLRSASRSRHAQRANAAHRYHYQCCHSRSRCLSRVRVMMSKTTTGMVRRFMSTGILMILPLPEPVLPFPFPLPRRKQCIHYQSGRALGWSSSQAVLTISISTSTTAAIP